MKLWMNKLSPFARKARILAREAGVADRIEEIDTVVSPVTMNDALARDNPLMKIPALVTDAGETLYDSPVICEYLDTLHQKPKFFPEAGARRFAAMRLQALTDGMMDAAVLCRYETAARPEAMRWTDWIEGQKRKVFGGLHALEVEVGSWGDEFGIAQISATCALGYLDFRFADWGWRSGHPKLAAWFERVSRRKSVAATMPPA